MDTITVIINGQMTSLVDNGLLPFATVELSNDSNNYKQVCDTAGHFKFYHIIAGKYKLTANCVGYRQLVNDSLHLETGDIATLILGLGSIGQDDLKQR